MLRYRAFKLLGQAVFPCKHNSVHYVLFQQGNAQLGCNFVVRVVTVRLIFHVIIGVFQLAYVVEICRRTRKKGILSDCHCARLDIVCNRKAVVEGTGRLVEKPLD